MPASCSSRLPLRPLQGLRQAVMQFIQLWVPPRGRDDVLAGQMLAGLAQEALAAVGAGMAVAGEQLPVGDRRHLAPGRLGTAPRTAMIGCSRRATAGRWRAGCRHASPGGVHRSSRRLRRRHGDHGVLRRNPGLRAPRDIELQHIHAGPAWRKLRPERPRLQSRLLTSQMLSGARVAACPGVMRDRRPPTEFQLWDFQGAPDLPWTGLRSE